METEEACPICFVNYGQQDDEDETFICKDGKNNSFFVTSCKHFCCVICIRKMSEQEEVRCPICREDWTEWCHGHYYSSDDEEEDDEEEEDEEEDEEEEEDVQEATSTLPP